MKTARRWNTRKNSILGEAFSKPAWTLQQQKMGRYKREESKWKYENIVNKNNEDNSFSNEEN